MGLFRGLHPKMQKSPQLDAENKDRFGVGVGSSEEEDLHFDLEDPISGSYLDTSSLVEGGLSPSAIKLTSLLLLTQNQTTIILLRKKLWQQGSLAGHEAKAHQEY